MWKFYFLNSLWFNTTQTSAGTLELFIFSLSKMVKVFETKIPYTV